MEHYAECHVITGLDVVIESELECLPCPIRQNLHVAIEAGRAARQVLADRRVQLARVFGHADQVAVWRAANPLRIGKGFGEVGLAEAEEFILVNVASFISRHYCALPDPTRQSGRAASCMAMISFHL